MKNILGLNAYHGDASACLIRDGRLVAAAEEERFLRIKHWAGFPAEAIGYCLREGGIDIGQVDRIAVNRSPYAQIVRKALFVLRHKPDISYVWDRFRHANRWASLEEEFARRFPRHNGTLPISHVEHHVAHLSSSFHVSPYDEAAVVSVDGSGDFATAAWGIGRGGKLELAGRIPFPHSLGIFYEALTQYLGFPHYGDEYKVMGLAPYGEPGYADALKHVVQCRDDGTFRLNLKYFRHHSERRQFEWHDCAPSSGELFTPELDRLLGPRRSADQPLEQRHKDIARSVQQTYERAFFNLLNNLYEHYRVPRLALAGGCAFNSVANGKIYTNTPFRECYIQAGAGDAGGAIGAAYATWFAEDPARPRDFVMDRASWGPCFSDNEIARSIAESLKKYPSADVQLRTVEDEAAYTDEIAAEIAAGKVVGWFQGRMEWGPRALGNRSIICDPRRADMKDTLNLKIKRRESFRPFAPSILREATAEWFETDDDVPFMMKVFQIRTAKRAQIPAVTHVDGSGRLQTVTETSNPKYYHLIRAFERKTQVPIVLNTSFNENEPIVCRPQEALDCFLRTKMDVLAIGKFILSRQQNC